MREWLQKEWRNNSCWQAILRPFSWCFSAIIFLRIFFYKIGLLKSYQLHVPVIVVGNISVGGTGKTPLVIWLAHELLHAGYQPGVISRGYGGNNKSVRAVVLESDPAEVGDEPVLIAKRTGIPVFVGANRVDAGLALLQAHPMCNVVVSDDGLQHYCLKRTIEIALINSAVKVGAHLLPAGQLREKVTRLLKVDAIVDSNISSSAGKTIENLRLIKKNGLAIPIFYMQLQGNAFNKINDIQQTRLSIDFVENKQIIALAGIANPERFFDQLIALGLQFEQKIYPDHYAFTAQDFMLFANRTILMTEKDAVKCRSFALEDAWYLPVVATLSSSGSSTLTALILKKLRL